MNVILKARARRYAYLDDQLKAILIKDIWLDYLRLNEGDHLHTLYDLEEDLATYEANEEYEVCQTIHDIIDNYELLSKLQLR